MQRGANEWTNPLTVIAALCMLGLGAAWGAGCGSDASQNGPTDGGHNNSDAHHSDDGSSLVDANGDAHTNNNTNGNTNQNQNNNQNTNPSPEVTAAPWTVRSSRTETSFTLHFGAYGDTPVPGDYDGDGITDTAVWRRYRYSAWRGPSSQWIIHQSTQDATIVADFGVPSDYKKDWPVPADYDGDGITDMAYLDEATNDWTIKRSSDEQIETRNWDPWPVDQPYAGADDDFFYAWTGEWTELSAVPAAADYDGDGLADLIAFRPYNAQWKIKQSSNDQTVTHTFGKAGVNVDGWQIFDLPLPGDYDGDGQAELAVYRPETLQFVVEGGIDVSFGHALDLPVRGDFDGDGITDVGLFSQVPQMNFTFLTDDLQAPGVEWPMRQCSPQVTADQGTYRLITCGESGHTYMPDAVYYAVSTQGPTSGYGPLKKIILDGCHSTLIKVPASINSRFSTACGASADVYLIYTEADSWPRPGVDMDLFGDPDQFASVYECTLPYFENNTRYNACTDADPTNDEPCCDLPHFPLGPYQGNKIVLYYSCDPDASDNTWTRVGPVITLDEPVPAGSSPGDPYGQGHPNAQFINGQVYVTYYSHNNNPDGTLKHMHTALAVSDDGEQFQKFSHVGGTVSQEVQYLKSADTFIGVGVGATETLVFWGKDLGGLPYWVLQGPWEHQLADVAVPHPCECAMTPGVLRNAHGIVEGDEVIVFGEEWTPNHYCYPLSDEGTWSLNGGDPYATRLTLDIQKSRCWGNRYRSCATGVQQRTCTATGWSAWGTCQ
jgi:hypothetical protein